LNLPLHTDILTIFSFGRPVRYSPYKANVDADTDSSDWFVCYYLTISRDKSHRGMSLSRENTPAHKAGKVEVENVWGCIVKLCYFEMIRDGLKRYEIRSTLYKHRPWILFRAGVKGISKTQARLLDQRCLQAKLYNAKGPFYTVKSIWKYTEEGQGLGVDFDTLQTMWTKSKRKCFYLYPISDAQISDIVWERNMKVDMPMFLNHVANSKKHGPIQRFYQLSGKHFSVMFSVIFSVMFYVIFCDFFPADPPEERDPPEESVAKVTGGL
jgi:hypothetical protein